MADKKVLNRVGEFRATPEKQAEIDKQGSNLNESEIGRAAIDTVASTDSGVEGGVDAMGNVSEKVGDTKENKGVGMQSGSDASSVNVDEIKASLLKNLPAEKVMRKQIEREIEKEIDYLHTKAMKMVRSPGDISYFELSNIMRKIRELKGILRLLIKMSLDGLKTLWLRYVHGIM